MASVKSIPLTSVKQVKLGIACVPDTPRVRGRARQARNARLSFQRPLCVMCEAEGFVARAEEWDHIVPLADGGEDHPNNLQGLCVAHHAAKTAREAKARAGGG